MVEVIFVWLTIADEDVVIPEWRPEPVATHACPACGDVFASPSALATHAMIHAMGNPVHGCSPVEKTTVPSKPRDSASSSDAAETTCVQSRFRPDCRLMDKYNCIISCVTRRIPGRSPDCDAAALDNRCVLLAAFACLCVTHPPSHDADGL